MPGRMLSLLAFCGRVHAAAGGPAAGPARMHQLGVVPVRRIRVQESIRMSPIHISDDFVTAYNSNPVGHRHGVRMPLRTGIPPR